MKQIPVTVLVQTKNEAVGIASCLASLDDFDEVIVVDSNSSDSTAEIARAAGVEVVNFTWNGCYPKKKQWQLENITARHDWLLFLDADETPSPELVNSIRSAMNRRPDDLPSAFDLHLLYHFSGQALAHGHRVVKRALVNRRETWFPVVDDLNAPGMGELEGHYQPLVKRRTEVLKGWLDHDDLDPVRTWFDRHNRYSDWEAYLARSRATSPDQFRSKQGRLFSKVPFKPLAFFVYSYIARLGFLDGRAGFDYAFALAGYYWQIELKTREAARDAGRKR